MTCEPFVVVNIQTMVATYTIRMNWYINGGESIELEDYGDDTGSTAVGTIGDACSDEADVCRLLDGKTGSVEGTPLRGQLCWN